MRAILRVGRTWGLADWYPNAGRFARRGKKEGELKGKKKDAPKKKAAD